MKSLRSLELGKIEIDDEFISVMAEVAGGSQVKQITDLSHRIGILSINEHNKIRTNEIQIQEIIDIKINLT